MRKVICNEQVFGQYIQSLFIYLYLQLIFYILFVLRLMVS